MFGSWSGGKTAQKDQATVSPSKAPASNGTTQSKDFDQAIESLARVLRCLGRHSFELEQQTEEEIEKNLNDGPCMCWLGRRFAMRILRLKKGRFGVTGGNWPSL